MNFNYLCKITGYSGTSLAPYMKTFIKFVNKLKRQREMSMNTELF